MTIDVQKTKFNQLNVPTVVTRHCETYEILAWYTGKRTPIVLGTVALPKQVDLEKLKEVLNAGV